MRELYPKYFCSRLGQSQQSAPIYEGAINTSNSSGRIRCYIYTFIYRQNVCSSTAIFFFLLFSTDSFEIQFTHEFKFSFSHTHTLEKLREILRYARKKNFFCMCG